MSTNDPNNLADLPSYGSTPPPEGGYPPQGPGGYPSQAPGGYGMPTKTNGKATASLVLGIVSFFCFGLVTGILAIVFSRMATQEIRTSNGTQTGEGLAKAGFILGIIGVVLWAAYLLLVLTGALDNAFA
ncbi:DUF4190 domain-containing protein [Aeromicrobium alkaliterrae]|uniref:DUF4190 domain-containing protein n=1 Tax=Aeromicrobium alkaliterrae TaxID=302168 RepID=A0ABN2JMT6_9ACTN